jgi:hypothetical protein
MRTRSSVEDPAKAKGVEPAPEEPDRARDGGGAEDDLNHARQSLLKHGTRSLGINLNSSGSNQTSSPQTSTPIRTTGLLSET